MNKKIKKIVVLLIICILIFLIYTLNHTTKLNYLALGDYISVGIDSNSNTNYGYSNYLAAYLKKEGLLENYTNAFATSSSKITDLIYNLEINQTVTANGKVLSLKKCLRDSDIVTLSIGMNDLLSKITLSTKDVEILSNEDITRISDDIIKELNLLFKGLRKYAKDKIIFIGFYDPYKSNSTNVERLYSYLQTKTKSLCEIYDIDYLDIYHLFKTNKSFINNPINIYPSTVAYQEIAKKIISTNFEN